MAGLRRKTGQGLLLLGIVLAVMLVMTADILRVWIQWSFDPVEEGLNFGALLVAMAMAGLPWVLVLIAAPAIVRLTRRFPLTRQGWSRLLPIYLAGGVIFTLLHVFGMTLGWMILAEAEWTWAIFVRAFLSIGWSFAMFAGLVYCVLSVMSLTVHYARALRRRELEASRLETSLAAAQLSMLRSQLNPHFLFNSLNAIAALALRNRDRPVAEMAGRLGSLLQKTLDRQEQEIALGAELNLLDDYLAVQRIRFADRLAVEKVISSETLSALVPTFMLQPIVENAVRHGVKDRPDGCTVNVTAERRNGSLVLAVSDDGPGFPAQALRFSEGLGLSNTRERLRLLYGDDQQLDCGSTDGGGAIVRLTIPFHEDSSRSRPTVADGPLDPDDHR